MSEQLTLEFLLKTKVVDKASHMLAIQVVAYHYDFKL